MNSTVIVSAFQVIMVLFGGPLLVGWMRKIRCLLEGRTGPPIHQLLLDIRKHARKERMRPTHASWLYSAAPVLLVSSAAVVAAFVPLVATTTSQSDSADLFAVVFLLLVGSVAIALGALDSGSAFGGMGSSRAMVIGALAEPALLVAILALSIPAHSSNLVNVVTGAVHNPIWLVSPQRLLALAGFLIVILAESGRLPVDNPATHLELTMIHEAMVLEYSGGDIALVKTGESMRLALFLGLLVNLFFPWGIGTRPGITALAVGVGAIVAKVAALGALIAAFELTVAKLRLFRVPELMAGAFVLGVLADVTAMVRR